LFTIFLILLNNGKEIRFAFQSMSGVPQTVPLAKKMEKELERSYLL
tara:strand:- start:270 stop:407 length:138 start_codon:yes stop_codon:yes gene_type:complete